MCHNFSSLLHITLRLQTKSRIQPICIQFGRSLPSSPDLPTSQPLLQQSSGFQRPWGQESLIYPRTLPLSNPDRVEINANASDTERRSCPQGTPYLIQAATRGLSQVDALLSGRRLQVRNYPMTINTASCSTLWPAVTSTLRTTPERTARISFSIFIASRIISG